MCWSQLEILAKKLKTFWPSEANVNWFYYHKWKFQKKLKILLITHIFGKKCLKYWKKPSRFWEKLDDFEEKSQWYGVFRTQCASLKLVKTKLPVSAPTGLWGPGLKKHINRIAVLTAFPLEVFFPRRDCWFDFQSDQSFFINTKSTETKWVRGKTC